MAMAAAWYAFPIVVLPGSAASSAGNSSLPRPAEAQKSWRTCSAPPGLVVPYGSIMARQISQ